MSAALPLLLFFLCSQVHHSGAHSKSPLAMAVSSGVWLRFHVGPLLSGGLNLGFVFWLFPSQSSLLLLL